MTILYHMKIFRQYSGYNEYSGYTEYFSHFTRKFILTVYSEPY